MPLLDQLQKDLVAAMKAKEEMRLSTVRMIKSAIQKAASVDPSKPLDEAAEQQLLKSLVKQRIDAADMFRKGDREELALKEEAERRIIESYLPASASEDDISAAVEAAMAETGATTAKQMGLVMKAAQAKLAGKTIDGKLLSEKVKSRLS
ncbi:MAG: GatB/YqeY domain-containing protein [Terriglobia bacterium]